MDLTQISPDQVVYWQWGVLKLNATIVFTWALMAVMIVAAHLSTRKLRTDGQVSRWQNFLEVIVVYIRKEIREISRQDPARFLPFVGTLFLFVAFANALTLFPGYIPPTASLSTTVGLAICVFVSVPVYGIADRGIGGYLKQYVSPSPVMLPFHILGELSRTLALAVRLFGNIMSGAKIVAVLLAVVPFIFPTVMRLLGLLTGLIHAYIFAVLSMVYIASAAEAREQQVEPSASSAHTTNNQEESQE
jgi:F-type H+-transporting ATPase subunit a